MSETAAPAPAAAPTTTQAATAAPAPATAAPAETSAPAPTASGYTQAQLAALGNKTTNRVGFVRLGGPNGTTVVSFGSVITRLAFAHLQANPKLVPIPAAEFVKLNGRAQFNWDGTTITSTPLPGPTIVDLQKSAANQLNSRAEAARMAFITNGPGMAYVYAVKEAEARRYLAAIAAGQAQPAGNWPYLTAQGAATLTDAANTILAAAEKSANGLAAVEKARREALAAIKVATDATGVATAASSVVWPS